MMLEPCVFNVLRGEALEVTPSLYGSVGQLLAGDGAQVVWVSKHEEEVDPGWFSQDRVDVILVVQGELRFEFEREDLPARVLGVGDCLVLPPNTRCRAYRWPRHRREASVFVAFSPRAELETESGPAKGRG